MQQRPGPVRPVLVGVDGSAHSMTAVARAAREARLRGLPLTVACVTRRRTAGPPLLAERLAEDAREIARGLVPGLAVAMSVRCGDPVETLVEMSGDHALLVVGRSGAHGARGGRTGTTTAALQRLTRCPLVVVDAEMRDFPLLRCTGPALAVPDHPTSRDATAPNPRESVPTGG